MPKSSRFSRFSSLLLGAALLLAVGPGCGRRMDRAELVMINGAELEVLDPAGITAQATSRVAYAIYEGLTAFSEKAKPEPAVAERWELSADGLHYTFHLRENVRWSNGDPVTSSDFVYAWTRALLPETASEYASQLYYIKNGQPFNEGKLKDASALGLRAPDPRTLEVTLESPTAYFLDLCAFSTYLPVHRGNAEAHPDWASNPAHFVGNGAFVLQEWRIFDRTRLAKNPRYWNAANVKLNSIDVLPSARPITAFNLYSTGQADLMADKGLAPSFLMDELKKRPDFHTGPYLGNYFFRFNVTRKPLNDPRVRRAIGSVIDKKLITEKITKGGEVPAGSLVPPGTGHDYQPPSYTPATHEEARQLLAEAGFPGGKGFPVIYYLYKGDSDLDRDIAVELQGMLARELGINLQLQGQEWNSYLQAQSALNYDISRSSWIADYNDPNTFLNMFVTNDGQNRTGWGNAEYDRLIAAAGRELDPEKRNHSFQQAEKTLISDEAPIVPLYYYVGIQFYDSARLGGFVQNLLDEHPLKFLYWKSPRP